MKLKGSLLLLLLTLTCNSARSQSRADALVQKSYSELQSVIDTCYDSTVLKPYLKAYLIKAKREADDEKVFTAYENYIYNASAKNMLAYADTLVQLAHKINTNIKLGIAYEHMATVHYNQKNYKLTLDNFLKADHYASKTSNEQLKYQIKYDVANVKYYLGFYDDALKLFQECAVFFGDKSSMGYINSMNSVALCYNKLGQYEKSTETNNIALEKARKTGDKTSIGYISHYEGVNEFSKKNYRAAVQKINEGLPVIISNKDFANETVAYFYLGKSHNQLGNEEKALGYFKRVDEAFREQEYTRPDLRENYEILINDAKKKKNIQAQLYYVNQLMRVDSVLNTNYKYLSGKIYKEYDTRKLLAEKKKIEEDLASRKTLMALLYSAVAVLIIAILALMYRHFKQQKKYKDRFEELMVQLEKQHRIVSYSKAYTENSNDEPDENTVAEPETVKANETKKPDINPEVVNTVLVQLQRFEEKNKFLKKELTLNDLASALNTNANYLSKIINYYKEKSFSNYLNDLRIDYIIEVLRNQPRYRNFTIKALAEEAGFANAQHFSKAFFARTGLYPSFFVNEMQNVYGNAVVSD